MNAADRRRLTPAFGIVAAILVVLLIALWAGMGRSAHWNDNAAPARLPSVGATTPAPAVPPLDQFAAVWQHPLFSPTRTPAPATAGGGASSSDLQLTGVMWTIIGYDWNRKVDQVVERISQRICNGAILCLHDGRELRARPDIGVTVETVRRLVPMLLDRGYRFETVSRLLCPTI